jgi:hypothetical protein
MKFFHSVTTAEEAKKMYRKLAKQFHPDCGGDNETMAKIVNEYEQVMKGFSSESEINDAYRAIIDAIINFDGLEIEIIGTWVWVSGNTYVAKDKLKELGFKWANGKKAWYWHEAEYKAFHKKKFSLDEIRGMHSTKTVKTSGKSTRGALAGV